MIYGAGLLIVFGALGYFFVDLIPGWLHKEKDKQGRELNPNSRLDPEERGEYYLVLTEGKDQVVIGERARYQHLQVPGATGAGKTRFGIYPFSYQDIMRGAGCAWFDVKSNMDEVLHGYAIKHGRVHDWLRFQVKDPEHSLTYNPLVGDSQEVANRVWTAFFQDDKTQTGFYREVALSFCRAFFGQCEQLGELPTLAQLQACLMDQDTLANLVDRAPETPDAHFLRTRCLQMDRKRFLETYEGFVNKLTPLVRGAFGRLLNTTTPQINMRDVATKGQLLYMGLAADLYPADYKIVSTMALMDLQSSLTVRYGKNMKGMFIYLDEFADLVYPEFGTLLSKAREAKVGLILAHQALGDLKAISDSFLDKIMTNTSNKVIFRVGSAETAEAIAKLAGTKTETNELINYSLEDGLVGQDRKAKGLTVVEGEAFLFHPNDLKNLGVGEALIIVQRKKGRELFRSKMIPAPDVAKHHGAGEYLVPKPGPAHKPLILGGQASAVPNEPLDRVQENLQKTAKDKKS